MSGPLELELSPQHREALEPSGEAMRAMVDEVMEHLVEHLQSLGEQGASYTGDGAALAQELVEPLPEEGTPLATLLARIFDDILPMTINAPGPGYLAYVPGGGVFHAAVAELLANAINRYTGVWMATPGLVQLEVNVIRWFADLIGYPSTAGGFLTSGGSLANLTAITTARAERLPRDFLSGLLYVSEHTHHSVQKAALLAGFPPENVRSIPAGPAFRIDLEALQAQLDEDRRAGRGQPFLLVGNAGTTNTGAVEPLDALADIAAREGLWFHVDAAYGGFFLLTDHGQQKMAGIHRADSVTLDPHKGLFLPYGTGALVVRDVATLRRTHHVGAAYLPPLEDGQVDFCAISPELSRDCRGLRVWLPLKLLGARPWRACLQEKIELARWIAQELQKLPHLQMVAPPELSLLAFRYFDPSQSPDALHQKNRQILEAINAKQRVFLTGTSLRGAFVIRICVLCFRTHFERIQMALEDIQSAWSSHVPPPTPRAQG